MRKFVLIALSFVFIISISAQVKKPMQAKLATRTIIAKGRLVEITTNYGTMIVMLYDSTPLHRDNFIQKVKDKFYDSLLFHRVINGFMLQGGDPQSKTADSTAMLGNGEAPGEMIPAEFRPHLIHKKGALAMARTDNPEKASSNCQFYIVQGKVTDDGTLNQIECDVRQNGNSSFYYNDAERKIYKTIGGTPFLDQNYTVFGEVIKGMDILDKIAAVQTNPNDRPLKNIRIKMRMLN